MNIEPTRRVYPPTLMSFLNFIRLDNPSIIIEFLTMSGICASTLLLAIKRAPHGHEDDFGFHFDFVELS